MELIDDPHVITRHRLTVDEYYRMAEAGILSPDARTELIEGEVIDMAPMKSRHAFVVNGVFRQMLHAVGKAATVTCQTPLRLGARSEPQPDLMLLRARADGYRDAHPTSADLLLVVEVADSSLRYDRGVKVPLYARHQLPDVWVLDLDHRRLHIHRQPDGQRYREVTAVDAPSVVALPGLEGLAVDLSDLLN